jgi:hypothetical protein
MNDKKSIKQSIRREIGNATSCTGPGNKWTQKNRQEGGHNLAYNICQEHVGVAFCQLDRAREAGHTSTRVFAVEGGQTHRAPHQQSPKGKSPILEAHPVNTAKRTDRKKKKRQEEYIPSGSTCNNGAGSRAQCFGVQWRRDHWTSNPIGPHRDTRLSPMEHK